MLLRKAKSCRWPKRSRNFELSLGVEQLESRRLLVGDLLLTGIIDGPLSGGTPKAVELYASADVDDLSAYGLGSANNGAGSDGIEFVLEGSLSQGQFIYVASDADMFESFFGFAPDYVSSSVNVNGDDGIELFYDSAGDGFAESPPADDVVIDVFGETDMDGTGTDWEYTDGWAYRSTGSEPHGASFLSSEWTFSGAGALASELSNAAAAIPFPAGSFANAIDGPEIDVRHDGLSIPSESSTSAESTFDFGSVVIGSTSIVRSFTIENTGSQILELTGSPVIDISGESDFLVSAQPTATMISSGESSTFELSFSPDQLGSHQATVRIHNSDSDEDPYTFSAIAQVQSAHEDPPVELVINEVDSDTPSTDQVEFIELFDGGTGDVPLDGHVIVLFNGNSDTSYLAIDLDGHATDEDGYFVIGNTTTPNVDFDFGASGVLQNGPDAVALFLGDADDFPNGTAVTTQHLVDAVVYSTGDADDVELIAIFGSQIDEAANGNKDEHSVSRLPDGGVFVTQAASPGVSNGIGIVAPEIEVFGNDISIKNGDTSPAIEDRTDFGLVVQNQASITQRFVIRNSGSAELILGPLEFVGSTAFSVVQPEVLNVIAGDSLEFSIVFTASAVGEHSGTVSIPNDDEDESPFSFEVAGVVADVDSPEIVIASRLGDDAIVIANGDATPDLADGTNFGSAETGNDSARQDFVISNVGAAQLHVEGVSMDGPAADDFLLEASAQVIESGESSTFSVTFIPSNDGVRRANVSVVSDDADDSPYTFDILGTGRTTAMNLVINEVDADTADENREFIELYDGGEGNTPLDGLTLVLFNGNGSASYAAFDLDGFHTDEDGFFVIGDGDTFGVGLVPATFDGVGTSAPSSDLQNGEDAVALYVGDAPDFPNGTVASEIHLVDAVIYETGPDPDTDLPSGFGTTDVYDEDGNGDKDVASISRSPDGGPFVAKSGTPGRSNGIVVLSPEIVVLGNQLSIEDGDRSPDVDDGTDLGSAVQNAASLTQTFAIANVGDGQLTLGRLEIDGSNGFSVTQPHTMVVEPGDQTTFVVAFSPTVIGTQSATVLIANDDDDESPYSFSVAAETLPPELPKIGVFGNGMEILNGDTTPQVSDGTDFGRVDAANGTAEQMFSIDNSQGDGDLDITMIRSEGTAAGDFIVTGVPAVVEAGEVSDFTVTFEPNAIGERMATLVIEHNDVNAGPYVFTISGTGITVSRAVLINEVDTDTPGTDTAEFIELFDGGVGDTALDGLVLVLYNGNGDTAYGAFQLDGHTTDGEGFFVLGNTTTPNVDLSFGGNSVLQNGPDAVALFAGSADDHPNGAELTSDDLLDAIVYGTGDPEDTELVAAFGPQIDESANRSKDVDSVSRSPDGGDWDTKEATPGEPNGIVVRAPEIEIRYRTTPIPDGELSTSADHGTDFGTAVQASPPIIRDFVILNDGIGPLSLGSMTIEGSGDFRIGRPLTTTVLPGQSELFSVGFYPMVVGRQEAVISLPNGDEDENPYSFSVAGVVTEPLEPKMEVVGNGSRIEAGDTTPSTDDHTDFGRVDVLGETVARSFTISNSEGSAPLLISDIRIVAIGNEPSDFSIVDAPGLIAPGAASEIDIQFDPDVAGKQAATVVIESNDRDKAVFEFAVQGDGISIARHVVINEVDADTQGTDTEEFVELYDGGVGNTPLDGLVVVLFNGNGDTAYETFELAGQTTGDDGFFVLGNPTTLNVDFSFGSSSVLQNGADAVALYVGKSTDFPNGATASNHELIDAVVYGTADDADAELEAMFGLQVDEARNGSKDTESVSRSPDGGSFAVTQATPGEPNGLVVRHPEIIVSWNGAPIASGDSAPNINVGTDFGIYEQGAAPQTRTFSVENVGEGTLVLRDLFVEGSADFTVGPIPSALAANTSSSLDVTLTPASIGEHVATVFISSNDLDEEVYRLRVGATVTPPPQPDIEILGNEFVIMNGDTAPNLDDGTDFASVSVSSRETRAFSIANEGSEPLEIFSIRISGPDADYFDLGPIPQTVGANQTVAFEIVFVPEAAGLSSATATVVSDDPDEPSYAFAVQGRGVETANNIRITEVDADTIDENLEFIELYDGGSGNTALDGLVVVLFNGSDNSSYRAIDLDGMSTNDNGYFVIGDADTPNVNFTPTGFDALNTDSPGSDLQNGEDAVAIYMADAADFPNDSLATSDKLLDALVYETGADADSELPRLLGLSVVADENENGEKDTESVVRIGNDLDTVTPTPGTGDHTLPDCEPNFGDFDGDGQVSFVDFLVLSNHFGELDASPDRGDTNCDREVKFDDFIVLAQNYGDSVL